MSVFYKAYFGGWEQGTPFLLHIPNANIPGYYYNSYTIQTATEAFPTWFDHTLTYFAADQTSYDRAISQGFLPQYVINLNGGSVNIYVSAEKWIKVDTNFFYLNGSPNITYGKPGKLSPFPTLLAETVYGAFDITQMYEFNFTLITRFNKWQPWYTFFDGIDPYLAPSDPYEGAGASGPGGGDGTFDFSSTPINYPGLPTIGAYSTGFLNVYVPSASSLRSLAS